MSPTYTLGNVGCHVDGARGIYAVDRIVEIAQEHGMAEPGENCENLDCAHCFNGGECEDEATEHMNEHAAVAGASWGRNDNGDWGLWAEEEK